MHLLIYQVHAGNYLLLARKYLFENHSLSGHFLLCSPRNKDIGFCVWRKLCQVLRGWWRIAAAKHNRGADTAHRKPRLPGGADPDKKPSRHSQRTHSTHVTLCSLRPSPFRLNGKAERLIALPKRLLTSNPSIQTNYPLFSRGVKKRIFFSDENAREISRSITLVRQVFSPTSAVG